jgi:ATP-dependent HslUV protease ATP-binding subunit HslU
MAIELPQSTVFPGLSDKEEKAAPPRAGDDLLPRETVEYLDRFIVGQTQAKRAVAKALRDRWRYRQIPPELQEEVLPKNILMIGPTGCGKTEISRRLAKLTSSPFLKVEASKFTEVGYVGRDVDSMVRDLVEVTVDMIKQEESVKVRAKARRNAEARLLDLLLPRPPRRRPAPSSPETPDDAPADDAESYEETRKKLRERLRAGRLDDRTVTVSLTPRQVPSMEIIAGGSIEEINSNLREMMQEMFSGQKKSKTMSVAEAREFLAREEEQKLIDMDRVAEESVARAESSGIIFLDEIDKIASRESGRGPEVSREGVQRDLLPIIEGTAVHTKYGTVRTDHILFIASGAFHVSKPSDLIPELQGRLPIRVELDSLTKEDFVRILREPENSLIRQYTAMMATEDVRVSFTDDAIETVAELAFRVNETTENIGARRLLTVMEKLFDEISFAGPENPDRSPRLDAAYVKAALADIVHDQDLSRYIL